MDILNLLINFFKKEEKPSMFISTGGGGGGGGGPGGGAGGAGGSVHVSPEMDMHKIVIGIILVMVLTLGYFMFYQPYMNQLSYQQNVECTNMVAKIETNREASVIKTFGSDRGWIFGSPQSHFNHRLNTCLGDFSDNYSINTASSGTLITFDYAIVDVVSNRTILASTFSKSPSITKLDSGVSEDEFKKKETVLMSE